MSFIIEARKKNGQEWEWEPISLTLSPRRYHFDTAREAEHCLETFFAREDSLPLLIVRLATGEDCISNLLDFRIVEVQLTKLIGVREPK